MKTKKGLLWIAVIGFLITLFLAEQPPFGKAAVAEHNGGFGTFDMEKYNGEIVEQVLSDTDETGFTAYDRYYVCDFAFILFCGLLQIMISLMLYENGNKYLRMLAVGIPILRGVLDAIENVILIFLIHSYPTLHNGTANISNGITRVKFAAMGVWCILVIIGIAGKRRKH